jgi:hypothetical protein
MKIVFGFVFLAATLLFSFPEVSYAGLAARARGVDDTYGSTSKRGCVNGVCPLRGQNRAGGRGGNKTCSGAGMVCAERNAGSAQACEAAVARCMQTGTFVGPTGRSASGLVRN